MLIRSLSRFAILRVRALRTEVLNLPPLPSVRRAKVGFRGQTRSICSVFETSRVFEANTGPIQIVTNHRPAC